jgi:RNA polymerase-interacting CarD/CdnL/TRCF family regulator
VTAKETRVILGEEHEVVVLALADGLSVSLPTTLAYEQLRPLATEADLRRVQKTLGEDRTVNDDVWLKRRSETQAKLSDGDPVGLAEIVRDGAQRESTLTAKGTKSQLSASERAFFVKARQLLSNEIALVRSVELDEANAWIDEQLARVG